MKKAGDICKRRLLALVIMVTVVSAYIETVSKVFAAEPKKVKVAALMLDMEETPFEEEPIISIVQEDTILGKIEESLSMVREKWAMICSEDCEDKESLELEIKTQLDEIEALQEEISTTCFSEEVELIKEDLAAMKSCREKLANVQITGNMDMSTVIGLNEVEIKYILLSVMRNSEEHLISNKELAKTLASAICEGAETYQVNELFIIGVMILETNWLTNPNVYINNFGGTRKSEEEGYLSYDTVQEGMLATISAIRNNMRGSNTSDEIALGYCRETPEVNKRWGWSTVSLAQKCLEAAK